MDYTTLESDFEEKSNKLFRNNVDSYTQNDKDFLKQLNQLFGNAMSAKGLNTLDPLYANFFHYNKLSMRGNVDFPRVNRTYVFFTRPELNFSFENINAVPFFKWLYSKRIGKMIFAALTDPSYFIYAPAALNNTKVDFKQMNDALTNWISAQKQLEKQAAKISDDNAWNEEMSSLSSNEDSPGKSMFDDSNVMQGTSESGIEASAQAAIDSENSSDSGMDDTANSNMPTDSEIDGLIDDVSMEALLDRQSKMKSIFDSLYKGNIQSSTTTKASVIGMTPAALEGNNLTLAKYALRDTHNSNNDKFNYTTPFIPLLQNTCTQLTGAKDFELQEHQYEEDEFSGKMTIPTGMDEIFGPGSFTTNHEDILYGPVSLLYMVWILYIHYVSRGYIMPTREHITERILDYTCSAYVFVIGDDGRRIERFGKYTGCYPTTFPLSQQLDHNLQVETDMLQKVSISWKYNRYEPMDPQVFTDFNFLSESEWLVKLNPALWEDLYNRYSSVSANMFLDLYGGKKNVNSEAEKIMLRNMKRAEGLWEIVKPDERGMSGKLPPALIEPLEEFSQINIINNFWGGYPYIVNGTEFCWVLPQFGKLQGVNRDEFNSAGKQVLGNESSDGKPEDMSKVKSGYDDLAGAVASVDKTTKKDVDFGNASSSYINNGSKNIGVLNKTSNGLI